MRRTEPHHIWVRPRRWLRRSFARKSGAHPACCKAPDQQQNRRWFRDRSRRRFNAFGRTDTEREAVPVFRRGDYPRERVERANELEGAVPFVSLENVARQFRKRGVGAAPVACALTDDVE